MLRLSAVTGAFSYSGRAIAEELLARGDEVRTLTRLEHPNDPLAARIECAPLVFDEQRLVAGLRGPPSLALLVVGGAALRDVVLVRDELTGLRAGLLVSDEPPLGRDRFADWLREHADVLGRRLHLRARKELPCPGLS